MIRLFVFCLSLGVILNAGIFDKDFNFKKADPNIDRKYPTNKEVVLSYNNILKNIRTSVVNISTKKSVKTGNFANPLFNDPLFEQFFRGFDNRRFNIPKERIQKSLGSGVIISSDGFIVTNHHVVDGADEIKVSIPGKKSEYDAKIIGTDKKSDIAVIKIKAKDLNAITITNSDKAKVGDIVFALGNPFGVGETITQGIISATRRSSIGIVEHENFIQTDASINPGNSGGALVNSAGHLVGINSAIISRSGGNVGIGFAIPSNMVVNISKALIKNGEFTRAYLGVGISDISEELSAFYGQQYGALITSVGEDTPAKKLGLKRGDLIIAVDNKKVESASDLKNIISSISPDTKVSIKYIRNKKELSGTIKLASVDGKSSSKGGYNYKYKGMTLEPITKMVRKSLGISDDISGVYVAKVEPNSISARLGIMVGDIIVQVEDNEINNIGNFKKSVKGIGKKRIYIMRRGGIYVVAL